MSTTEEFIQHFREGFQAGVDSIMATPKIEDREAFRDLRRRVTVSSVQAHGLSGEDEQMLLRAMTEARDVGEAVLDRIVAEHLARDREPAR